MRFARLMQLQPSFPSTGELGPAPQGDDDAALIVRIAAGDRHAFNDLVVRHGDRARLLSLRILGHHDIAEMLVEDVFAELWASRGHCVSSDGNFRTWLCRAVVTRCRPSNGVVTARLTAAEPQAEPGCYSGAALDQAMAGLNGPERTVIVLAYHEGAPLDQIALAMQISSHEVERLLTAARRSLLASLAPTPTCSAAMLADRKFAARA